MESGSSAVGLMGLWIFFQFVFVLIFLIGGLYVLFCLNRAAAGLDRMASVAEAWFAHQMYLEQQKQAAQGPSGTPQTPSGTPSSPPATTPSIPWQPAGETPSA